MGRTCQQLFLNCLNLFTIIFKAFQWHNWRAFHQQLFRYRRQGQSLAGFLGMHAEGSHGHLHLEGLCLLYCSTIVFLEDLIILKNEVCVFIFHWAPQVSQSYHKSFQRQAKVSKKQNNCKGAKIKEWLPCINFHSWQRYSHAHTFVCTTQCSLLTWLLLLFSPFFP